jgi:hypothetical protein
MNKGRLIGGIICLAIAILLGILSFTLEPGDMKFEIGDQNMPWVPPVVLGVIGILLLATVNVGAGREPVQAKSPSVVDPDKAALNKRIETVAWGLFFVMLGCRLLVPDTAVPSGVWSICIGLILIGLNVARYFFQIKMSGFTIVLGILAIIGGILSLVGMEQVEGPILLIVVGAALLLRPWFEKRALIGSSEEREAGQ